jgi:uncharacterized protein
MDAILQNNISSIKSLCQKYHVDKLAAFGSVLSDRFTGTSDVDMVVKFKQMDLMQYADNYFDLKFALEKILKRKVDLLEEQAIKNPYLLKSINSSKQLVYGGAD